MVSNSPGTRWKGGNLRTLGSMPAKTAEKAVEAVHHAGGARAVLGHSVRALIERIEPRVNVLDRLIDTMRDLDLYYIPTRYPNGIDSGTPREAFSESRATRAVRSAAADVEATRQCLASFPPPTRPSRTRPQGEEDSLSYGRGNN